MRVSGFVYKVHSRGAEMLTFKPCRVLDPSIVPGDSLTISLGLGERGRPYSYLDASGSCWRPDHTAGRISLLSLQSRLQVSLC